LRHKGYRVSKVRNLRSGEVMRFSQAAGSLTIDGITGWDTCDTVFTVETAGRVRVARRGLPVLLGQQLHGAGDDRSGLRPTS
jgi:hypothetical protein